MFNLRPIANEAIPRALDKAERYRLLNEPREAESICRDVLAADPGNQGAAVGMLLAMTDLFRGVQTRPDEARRVASGLSSPYERAYYAGVVEERWAKALLESGYPKDVVYRLIRAAMEKFNEADRLAPDGNDDALLRWNSCVRIIESAGLTPPDDSDDAGEESLDDDVPVR